MKINRLVLGAILSPSGPLHVQGLAGRLRKLTPSAERTEQFRSLQEENSFHNPIVAGYLYNCVLLNDANVRCFGRNDHHQLGNGGTASIRNAVDAKAIDFGNRTVVKLSSGGAGAYHNCAILEDDALACWGLNNRGQLGDGTTSGSNGSNGKDPVFPDVGGPVKQVSIGWGHTCVVMKTDGWLKCWGRFYGGSVNDASTPVVIDFGDNQRVKHVCGGYTFFCVLLDDGSVKCSAGSSYTAVSPGVGGLVKHIDCGNEHICVIMENNSLKCWGNNGSGQLGDGTTTSTLIPTLVSIDPVLQVRKVQLGHYHTCAIMENDALYCWGRGNHGQLGNGQLTATNPNPTLVSVGNGRKVVHLALGSFQTCAVLDDGGVRCWGWNNHGALGDSSFPNSVSTVPDSALDFGNNLTISAGTSANENPSSNFMPSGRPSYSPSSSPVPSTGPSEQPSTSPVPSALLSGNPSTSPAPSKNSSGQPSTSEIPSSLPSAYPSISIVPSGGPSNSLTSSPVPSAGPSKQPSSSPVPSAGPSKQPSSSPLPSAGPSKQPSTSPVPSALLSGSPSISPVPTKRSSDQPSTSLIPSVLPSPEPNTMAYDEWGIHLKSDSLTVNATSDDSNTGIQLGFVMLVGQALQQRYDVEIMGGDCKASVVPEEVVMSLPVQSDVSATSGGFVSEYKQMKTLFEMDPTKITGSNLWIDTSTNMDNTQGNATFCARTLLYYDNNTPNDTTDDVLVSFFNAVFLLNVDLSGKSFVLTAATEALENEDAGSTTIENEYQVQACFCLDGYECIDDQDSVTLVQNSEVHICLKPESADTEIATFWMEMNQESNPSDLLPLEVVADGEGVLLTSIESNPSDDVIKITSRLLGTFFQLDLSPLPAITVIGKADLVFKSSGSLRHLAQDIQNNTQGSRKAQGHTFGHNVINARRATESDGTPANSNAAFEMTINIAQASDGVDVNNDDGDAAHPDEKVNIKSGQAQSAASTLSKGLSLTVVAALFVAIQG